MIKIPNVYGALNACGSKVDLAKIVENEIRNSGYDNRQVIEFFSPVSCGAVICHAQASLFLSLSATIRGKLVTRDECMTYDSIVSSVVRKWSELHKSNRSSKVLTDNFGHTY